ncbi:efflux RND transporter periplasmic adaptor subunit [Geobacter hydrogenophilus]|uniref:Drug-efflux protein n=1 Tax=Geobacter hydrogenophilus TaxID=40983 RepID=A0A9W6FZT7_9BACT|nr:efflux RND transporter periplasmic adaptor subunit [Geobacter hydrogenophilus]MBT0893892.1 efflux RND transporter periplasmic adaptor subunit [Geobacter hydrogenophilus]GLI38164.1 drug-efflux protein [Geobacter hydrogenophilus]
MNSPNKKKNIIIGIIVILLVTAGVAAARKFFAPQKITYITAPASRMDLEESVLATGILKAFKTVAVGAQVTGQLKTLHVALGDTVKKGQLLAEIDPVLPQNTLRDAEAQVDNLQAQKRSKQALLKQYELAFQRQSQMNAKDAGSRADLESAQAQLESTRHDIAALEAQIRKAIIAVDTARANLGYTRIHAPIDGTVISIDTEEGQTVVSNQTATTILTLATLDTMTVKAKISEADVTRVKPGLPTYFTLLGDSDTRYYGKLRAIEPGPVNGSSTTGSSSTGSSSSAIYYYGLFEVPNPDNKLKVSMTTQVAVVLNQARQALCVPVAALGEKQKDGKTTVLVLAGEQPVPRTIRTGISNNVQIQVLDGLKEGEKVVLGDSSNLPKTDPNKMPPPGRR